MSKAVTNLLGRIQVKAIYRFKKNHNTKTGYILGELKGIRHAVLEKKMTNRVYLTDPRHIKSTPKPLYTLTCKGHITSLFKACESNSSTILTGDLGKDYLRDLLLIELSKDKDSLEMYHIGSDKIIKDVLERAVVEIFNNGYFVSDISNLDNQLCFDFMGC